jgi:hypothetical protein
MRSLICLFVLAGCQASAPPPRPAAAAQVFCARSLGTPDCYAVPASLPDHPAGIADTPDRPPQPGTPWWKKITDHWQD